MASILLVDDAAALAELFSRAIADALGHRVEFVTALADVGDALKQHPVFDLALVDMSFPQEHGTGLWALAEIHRGSPTTRLAIITQGDEWVAEILRDCLELLPIATVISKTAPLDYQLAAIRQVLAEGTAPPDPAIRPLLPRAGSNRRTPQQFEALVQHAGHAKLWRALMAETDVSYKALAVATGLKLNTLKNYRAQIVPELVNHGLVDPSLRDMRLFANRCRPFLDPYIDERLGVSRA